ncbi:phosphate acyltransferase PlsX [Tenuibacillus multivorans]|uniref:Phosphate acyltransferase n=1 Tax=Tenuibacillus multivorans TaxID=237069 RepID=A0A1G9Y2W3_9BACI|nr:phosphate acyltransferase PlsX [Tenuibacillus multivorans]GEL75912.1 phosphate acyltransferase [Tenuibacillus multivorans]SDN03006.1 glycerol-3-phosphate acyltransferase PlsX [Tenuibacillus multivorans]
MKIAIDAMGGDHAPEAIVKGASLAVDHYHDLELTLFGNREQINSYLDKHPRIHIHHTTEKVENTDEPSRVVRKKKDASMVLMAEAVKNEEADACISAGNTGALMSTGLFKVGRIKGIDRPALSPTLPTTDGKGFLLLDVGANVETKPNHLLQYAVMGSIYVENVRNINNPRVGLLNVGTEDQKGSDTVKEAFQLLQQAPINFVGNVEARDLLEGVADVVVTDGFSGNIALKSIEGTALTLFSIIKQSFMKNMKTKLAAAMVKSDLKGVKDQLDYSEYGGAGLFGLRAPVIKAHGSSNERAIFNAIKQTYHLVEADVVSLIEKEVKALQEREA